jgi:DNA-binding XRE family transcriptional regulator
LERPICYGIEPVKLLSGLPDSVNAKRSEQPPPPIDPALRNTLAKNLRAARLDAGLSQLQLGELANLSRKYVSQIERGTANVSLDVVTVLAKHLGKPPITLLTEAKPRSS